MNEHRSGQHDRDLDPTAQLEQRLRGLVPRPASCQPDWSQLPARSVARPRKSNWLTLQLMGAELSRWGAAAVLLLLWGLGAAAGGAVAVAWLRVPASPELVEPVNAGVPIAGGMLDEHDDRLAVVVDNVTNLDEPAVERTGASRLMEPRTPVSDFARPWQLISSWAGWLAESTAVDEEFEQYRWRAGSGHRLVRSLETAEQQRAWRTQATETAFRQRTQASTGVVPAASESDSPIAIPTGGSNRQSLLRDLLQPDSGRIL